MFPTIHYSNPESYVGFTSANSSKESFSKKDKSMADTQTCSTYHTLIYKKSSKWSNVLNYIFK